VVPNLSQKRKANDSAKIAARNLTTVNSFDKRTNLSPALSGALFACDLGNGKGRGRSR